MKKNDIRHLSPIELEKLLSDTQDEILKLRIQKAIGQLDNIHLIRNKRKTVARVTTILNNKKTVAAS